MQKGKTKSKGIKAHWFLAAPLLLLFIFLYGQGSLDRLENNYLDLLFKMRLYGWGVQKMDDRIILAALDEKSVAEIGSVPWPRSVYAELIEELMRYDPALVVFDILFTEPDRRHPDDDKALVSATRKWKNKIIHCFSENIETFTSGSLSLPKFSVLFPFDELAQATRYAAYVDDQKLEGNQVTTSKDQDGTRRRVFLAKETAQGDVALSLGALPYAIINKIDPAKFYKEFPQEVHVNFPGVYLKTMESGATLADDPYPTISISDILKRKLSKEQIKKLKGAILFIASTTTGYFDHHPTPYKSLEAGVSMHIYSLNGLIQKNHLKMFSRILIIFLMALMGFSLAVALERYSALTNLGLILTALATLWGVSIYLFVYKNLVLDAMVPSISTFLIFASSTLYRIAVEEKEKRWIKSTFSQYLSPKVVSLLVENPEALKLGGEKRMMTVLFLDIAHFTTLSEKLAPEDLTRILNHYLTIFTDIVLKYDGVVDKFIGDCVMAFWNAPFDQSQHPLQACLAAIEMREKALQAHVEGMPQIDVRIGVHTGYMVVGNMGSQARFNYTVVGDNVNFASRLEGANKYFHSSILTSEVTYELCKNQLVARELGKIRVVGKENPVAIYEVLAQKNGTNPHQEDLKLWETAMEALKNGGPAEAKNLFEKYLQTHPEDAAAKAYIKLIDAQSYEFIINLTEK